MPSTENESEVIQHAKTFVPDLVKDFKFTEEEAIEFAVPDKRNEMYWKGGEKEGLARLDHFLQKAIMTYSDTRNGLLGADYSSKLSPWISNGSLGIRFIYQQVYPTKSKHVQKFIDEIFWRDYMRFFSMKAGNKMFSAYGIHDREFMNWKTDQVTVQRWKNGMTGMPLIDALMRELNATGFMSNRGRQIVASYLTFDL